MRKLLFCLGLIFLTAAARADHDEGTTPAPTRPEIKIPEKPKTSSTAAKPKGDVKSAEFQHLIYLDSGDPVHGNHDYAYNGCNGLGYRLPNLDELEEMATAYEGRLFDKFKHKGCLWSSTPVEGGRFGIYSFDISGRGWGDAGFKGCSTVCLAPKDPIQDIIDLCPVGAMDYCVSGQGSITQCDGKECTPDFRCICGDFTLALSRCLKKKMGKKSWTAHSICSKGDKSNHATTIVKAPYTTSSHLEKYCLLEAQRVEPGQDPKYCCWVQDKGDPNPPKFCREKLCGPGDDPADNLFKVYEAPYNYYDDDFAERPQCLRQFMFKTGIDGKHLVD